MVRHSGDACAFWQCPLATVTSPYGDLPCGVRYLLEKIAARIQQEGLEETIIGMLDREKRP